MIGFVSLEFFDHQAPRITGAFFIDPAALLS